MDSTLNSVVSDDYTSPDEGTTIFNGVFYDFFLPIYGQITQL